MKSCSSKTSAAVVHLCGNWLCVAMAVSLLRFALQILNIPWLVPNVNLVIRIMQTYMRHPIWKRKLYRKFTLLSKRPGGGGEPVKTATLQNDHNQNGHTEWDHYQNGHTTLVKRATLLWSKRPHKMGSYQNSHSLFGHGSWEPYFDVIWKDIYTKFGLLFRILPTIPGFCFNKTQ